MEVFGPPWESWAIYASPAIVSVPVPPLGTLRLDLATILPLASGSLDGSGRATATWFIPPDPGGLAGTTIFGQALVGSSNPRLTNLEAFTFTNL